MSDNDDLGALKQNCNALHTELRKRVIFGPITKKWRGCDVCKRTWEEGKPEQHANGCLAAP